MEVQAGGDRIEGEEVGIRHGRRVGRARREEGAESGGAVEGGWAEERGNGQMQAGVGGRRGEGCDGHGGRWRGRGGSAGIDGHGGGRRRAWGVGGATATARWVEDATGRLVESAAGIDGRRESGEGVGSKGGGGWSISGLVGV